MSSPNNMLIAYASLCLFLGTWVTKAGTENDLVFNTTVPSNDLKGTLPAQVLFAQSQVIPACVREGDRQPHLVSLRKTLLMVRLHRLNAEPLSVTALDTRGQVLGVLGLNPPMMLPKTAYFVDDAPSDKIDFTITSTSIRTIKTLAEIAKLAEPNASALQSWLRQFAVVQIETEDGRWVRDIYLPAAKGFDGKVVRINAGAGYTSVIHNSTNQITIGRGQSLLFKCANGRWFREGELENNAIRYASDAWSTTLPATWIQPGMTLKFKQGSASGELVGLKIGAPTELLIHTIDLGFLTPPRGAFIFAKNPEVHREYFQTIPASRLIVTQYAPLHLTEVMLPTGVLLKDRDPGKGGWHEGTMRQSIGKELISHGIDNANYGLHSTPGKGEKSHPYLVAQLTAHNSRGNYANGIQVHGGSGGGGIVTLDNSIGNELSHEVGHNYGLGHYVDGFKGSVHRSADNINSTWGWDADKNRFIPNFFPLRSDKPTTLEKSSQAPFAGRSFGLDAMAGGSPFSVFNRFTLYTPNTAAIIQTFLEGKAVYDSLSPTGFRIWNPQLSRMEPYVYRTKVVHPISVAIKEISEAGLAKILSEHAHIQIAMSDGNWKKEIPLPAASTANLGRVVRIAHSASYNSVLLANAEQITITSGFAKTYVSDGKRWKEGAENSGLVERKPQSFGVPVVTLVGYYDPSQQLKSYIYPALHGAFGYCYPDDASDLNETDCQLLVATKTGVLRFRLDPKRLEPNCMNKFHVNVPESSQPQSVSIICDGKVLDKKTISPLKEKLTVTVNGMPLAAAPESKK